METPITVDKFRFLLYRLKEKLWIKPLLLCVLSIACVFAAKAADSFIDSKHIPNINAESVETLLSIMASTMMVIATFSAGTMVNAYSSAGHSTTPRSLSLIISDDVSQYALSVFVGAFIYSAVAITAMHLAFFDTAGVFYSVLSYMHGFCRRYINVYQMGRQRSAIRACRVNSAESRTSDKTRN